MTTFHDALSGKKVRLNFKTKPTPAPYVRPAWCEDAWYAHSHSYPNEDDEQSRCVRCGISLLAARVKENLRKKT